MGNPLGCAFKPAQLRCTVGRTTNCLTDAQVQAAERIYDGPPHSEGRSVRGALPGSEYQWGDPYFGYSAGGSAYFDNFFKYMVYGASPGWSSETYNFEQDHQRLGLAASYSATNPDLRRFKAAGGKLLVYQGGNDLIEIPTAIVDYYQTVEKVTGGAAATQAFFRLFIIPGMNHCYGGIGAYAIDYLSYLEAWVEENRAPDVLIGAHVSDEYLASLPLPDEIAAELPPDAPRYLRAAAAGRLLRFPSVPPYHYPSLGPCTRTRNSLNTRGMGMRTPRTVLYLYLGEMPANRPV